MSDLEYYENELDGFHQALEDFFHEENEREYRINKISQELCGCPFDIIDEITDAEVVSHYKQKIMDIYNSKYNK